MDMRKCLTVSTLTKAAEPSFSHLQITAVDAEMHAMILCDEHTRPVPTKLYGLRHTSDSERIS